MHGASDASVFNFCGAFLANIFDVFVKSNLQSNFISINFSLREFFMCKSPIFSVLGSGLFKSI